MRVTDRSIAPSREAHPVRSGQALPSSSCPTSRPSEDTRCRSDLCGVALVDLEQPRGRDSGSLVAVVDPSEAVISHLQTALAFLGVVAAIVAAIKTRPAYREPSSGPRTSVSQVRSLSERGRPNRRPSAPAAQLCQWIPTEQYANSVRCSGRIPLERRRHERRLVDLWQLFALGFLCDQTTPKSAFTITQWRLHSKPTVGFDNSCNRQGGFILTAILHKGENRYHLRRSIQSSKILGPSHRLVVIATAAEVANPNAQVRCLVVDSYSINLPEDTFRIVAISNADPKACNGPISYSERRENIPPDAIWLVSATSGLPIPSPTWGRSGELLESYQSAVASELPQEHYCDNTEEFIAKKLRRARHVRIIGAFIAGPLTGLFLFGVLWLLNVTEQPQQVTRVLTILNIVWFIIVTMTFALYLIRLGTDSVTGWIWCRRERMLSKEWSGGTLASVLMGSLLSEGPQLLKDDWKRFWLNEDRSGEGANPRHGSGVADHRDRDGAAGVRQGRRDGRSGVARST